MKRLGMVAGWLALVLGFARWLMPTISRVSAARGGVPFVGRKPVTCGAAGSDRAKNGDSSTAHKTIGRRLIYLPAVDGLRAVAVIAVLLYHAQSNWLRGGFLGVDVFFVISGYLITSLLLAEWGQRDRIDLPAFWLRRARRLLPAVFLLIGVTLVFAVVSLPGEVAGLRGDASAALGYVTNWYLVFSHQSYFEMMGRPSLFRHLWSLAVEEQFYILWPPILAAILWLRRPRLVLVAVLAGAVASTVLMAQLYRAGADPSRVYYGTDTRGVGLLVGSALAFIWAPGRVEDRVARVHPLVLDVVGLGALGVLFYAFFRFDGFQPFIYRGGFALVAVASAVLIAVLVHPRAHIGRAFLGRQPLRWLGLRSYGIYLWHWPVFMLTRPQLDVPIDGLPLLALRLTVTVAIAELSYRLVETPVRGGALGRLWRRLRDTQGWRLRYQWAAGAGAALASFVVLGLSVASAEHPAPPPYLAVQSVHIVAPAASSETAPAANPTPFVTPLPRRELSGGRPAPATPTALVEAPPLPTPTAVPPIEPTAEPAPPPAAPAPEVETEPAPAPSVTSPAATTEDGTASQASSAGPAPSPSPATTAEGGAEAQTPAAAPPPTAPPGPAPEPPPPPAPTEAPPPPPAEPPSAAPAVRVTAIGDSVMLGAADALASTIGNIEVDAKVGRQAWEAVNILRQYHDAGTLGEVVVVHMGNNGQFIQSEFDQMMEVLAGVRRVVFVNLKVPRDWEGANNSMLAENVALYPNAVLVDWRGTSIGRPDFFWDDGIHLRPEGAQAYAQLIAAAVAAP